MRAGELLHLIISCGKKDGDGQIFFSVPDIFHCCSRYFFAHLVVALAVRVVRAVNLVLVSALAHDGAVAQPAAARCQVSVKAGIALLVDVTTQTDGFETDE